MWLPGVEDMLSQRSRCEDSFCRRKHTNLGCLKWSRTFRRKTALGGPAVRCGLLPSHSRSIIISLFSESVKHWNQESCKCTLTSWRTAQTRRKKQRLHYLSQVSALYPGNVSWSPQWPWRGSSQQTGAHLRLHVLWIPRSFSLSLESWSLSLPPAGGKTPPAQSDLFSFYLIFLLHFLLQFPGVTRQVRASLCLQLCKCTNVFKRLSWNQPKVNRGLGTSLLVKVWLTEWITLIFLTFLLACLPAKKKRILKAMCTPWNLYEPLRLFPGQDFPAGGSVDHCHRTPSEFKWVIRLTEKTPWQSRLIAEPPAAKLQWNQEQSFLYVYNIWSTIVSFFILLNSQC